VPFPNRALVGNASRVSVAGGGLSLVGTLCALIFGGTLAATEPVRFLDIGSSTDRDDQMLVTALQGIVNRDGPRLFLQTHFWVCPSSDDAWRTYLTERKGYSFQDLGGLDEAVQWAVKDGRIKGLVLCDHRNIEQTAIAMMLAGRSQLLPVTDRLLKYDTEMFRREWTDLSGNLAQRPWHPFFADPKHTDNGLVITTRREHPKSAGERVVRISLAAAPLVEITVSGAAGRWGLQVNPHTSQDLWLLEPTDQTGTFTCDLRKVMNRDCPRALLRIRTVGAPGTSVTVTSVRFLKPDGTPVEDSKEEPTIRCFESLPVVEDLRIRFADDQAAFDWAMRELLPGCSKDYYFHLQAWAHDLALDFAVANQVFIYRERQEEVEKVSSWNKAPPRMTAISARLNKPAYMLGWRDPEWVNVGQLSSLGDGILCMGAPNMSFWKHVPVDGPLKMPDHRTVHGPLEEKYYVVYMVGDGDTPKNLAGFHSSSSCWLDAERGSVPLSWGMPTRMLDFAPAMLEYYARTASPVDAFFAGPSGAGYTNPTLMPDPRPYVVQTLDGMTRLGLKSIDFWDVFYRDFTATAKTFTPTGRPPVISTYFLPDSGLPPRNVWLDDGTFFVLTGGKTKDDALWCWGDLRAEDLARRLMANAEEVDPPFFLVQYGHFPPKILAETLNHLPKDRFQAITVPDMERLAADAGALTVDADSSGIAPGTSVAVTLTVRNPGGRPGAGGRLTWDLPARWTAPETAWDFGPIPAGGCLRHTVAIFAPAELPLQPARIRIPVRDSRLGWRRILRLNVVAESRSITDFTSADGWESVGNGKLTLVDGHGQFYGMASGDLVRRTLALDFRRRAVLEMHVPSTATKWSMFLTDGKQTLDLVRGRPFLGLLTFDLSELNPPWTEVQRLQLTIRPHDLGTTFLADSLRLLYKLPAAPLPDR
jgi:hypothetical protein